jgi:hypothetical protein
MKYITFFLFLLSQTGHAQDTSVTRAVLVYTHSPGADSRFYNGTLYPGYDHQPQGSPFFGPDSLSAGSICYDEVIYPDIRLSYDLVKDAVIIADRRNAVSIQLLPEKIRFFTIGKNRFIYLSPGINTANAPQTGFYEELYSGKATALARHEKTIQPFGKADENIFQYRQYDRYYLEVNGRYYTIHNNRSLLDAFGAAKDPVRNFLRKNRISFSSNREYALAKAAEFYSQLNN